MWCQFALATWAPPPSSNPFRPLVVCDSTMPDQRAPATAPLTGGLSLISELRLAPQAAPAFEPPGLSMTS